MQNLYQAKNSDSLAQTTLKRQRLSGANSYKKMFHVKHHGGITVYSIAYCRMFVKSYRISKFNVLVTLRYMAEHSTEYRIAYNA